MKLYGDHYILLSGSGTAVIEGEYIEKAKREIEDKVELENKLGIEDRIEAEEKADTASSNEKCINHDQFHLVIYF